MGGKGPHRQCVICGIRERHKGERVLLFANFPLDETRCKDWIRVIGDEDLVHIPIKKLRQLRHVCGDHFEKSDLNKKGTCTKGYAIPRLNLTASPLTDSQMIGCLPPAHSENNPLEQHSTGDPSAKTKNDEVAEKRKLEGNIVQSPRKKILMDISNTKPVLEAVASTSESSHEQNIRDELSLGIKTLVDITNIQTKTVLEAVASTSKSAQEQNIPDELSLGSKLLVDITNTQTNPVLKAVASTSKSGQKQNVRSELTSREKKLMEDLRKTKCTLRALKKSAKIIENLDSEVLKEFVMSAFQNQKRKPQGRRWTPKNKISALAIYKRSPMTYRYMAHTMPLPSVRTLQNLLKKVPMDTGINQAVLEHLRKKSEKKRKNDKLCCLLFDEIALKNRLHFDPVADKVEGFQDYGNGERTEGMADHALVFMLQGVRAKFKMPLAYYFTKGTVSSQKLAALIKEIIAAVEATGYKIIATVCDQGPTNMGAMNLLKAGQSSEEVSFFKCGTEKIYTIFDVPHLFKSLRNNFYNNGVLVMGDKKAKWTHLIKMEEKNRNMLFLTTIPRSCVEPKYRAKMKVKLAAQLLSRQVSAVLKLMADAEKDPNTKKEIRETADIVFELDRLFDPIGPI